MTKKHAINIDLCKRPDLECRIDWKGLSRNDWENCYAKIRRANLLQSPLYADVIARLNQQTIRRGQIWLGHRQAGIVQIIEAGILNNFFHGIIIDRGPLWYEDFGSEDDFYAFLRALRREFPARLCRKMRFIPEMPPTDTLNTMLMKAGFKKHSQGYQTIWLDLSLSLEELRKNLKPNWRNKLNKAQKSNLSVQWTQSPQMLNWFISGYSKDKREKDYNGPPPRLLLELAKAFLLGKNILLGAANLDGRPVAGVIIFCHGKSATYQAGWTTDLGRQVLAHHYLLWDALGVLKERKVYDFDLGGINDKGAKGVGEFKCGLGGEQVETAGIYT